jgi:hypothetical protein
MRQIHDTFTPMKNIHHLLFTSLLCLSIASLNQANASIAHSVGDAAPVVGEGEYSGRLLADVLLNEGGGLNITPRFKTGVLDQYIDLTTVIGAGSKTRWQVGAIGKYNLLPDMQGQAALSFLASFHILKIEKTALNFGGGMVVSKKFQANFGEVTPYGSLELDLLLISGDSTVPVHLNFGAIWEPTHTGPWSFISEAQLGLAKGYYAISLGTAYRF